MIERSSTELAIDAIKPDNIITLSLPYQRFRKIWQLSMSVRVPVCPTFVPLFLASCEGVPMHVTVVVEGD